MRSAQGFFTLDPVKPEKGKVASLTLMEGKDLSALSPKGVPHIFEYAVGPGVFSASMASRFSPEWILVPCSDQGY